MTAPDTKQSGEKIAMTAPVTQTMEGDSWIVRFFMPANYTLQTLPRPNNRRIQLKEIARSRYAVIRFSGKASPENLSKHTAKLLSFLDIYHLKTISKPIYAFFNPPWTLLFLRRNEVMLELGD